jgi:PAS domain S-box-containing protein
MDKRITLLVPGMLSDMNRYCILLVVLSVIALLSLLTPSAYFVMLPNDFLPLHTMLEFASVWVAFMVFGVTWHSLSPTRPANITMLGCAMLASGLLDFGHTLSYRGMPDFVTPSSPEKGIAFWLAARLTVATGLCIASFMSTEPLRNPKIRYMQLFGYSLYTLLIFWLVLFHQSVLPRTFIEGQGLTQFKIACEWGIIGLLAVAASRFWHRTLNTADVYNLKTYFFAAATVFILSEMFFTQYKSTSDVFNVLGHLYKIIGYFLLYQAVFVKTIHAPYHEVEQQQTRYRQLFENMTSCGAVYQAVDNGNDFIFLEVNHAAERTEKLARNDFIGKRLTQLFPGAAGFGVLEVLRRVWRTGNPEHFPAKFYQDERISGWRENYFYRLADGNIVAIYDDVTERKLSEQALQESEKNFRIIFETAAIGMAEADPVSGQLLRVNSKFCQMLGYSAKELIGLPIARITHPDDRNKHTEDWRRLIHGEVSESSLEKRYRHKNGHEIWAHLNLTALRDENGKAMRILAAVADITERKQAEIDRRRYNQELKSIFDALPDFYFHLGPDGTILSYHANPTAIGELYVPPEQFLHRRMADTLPAQQAELFAAKIEEQQRTGKIVTFEYQLTVDGTERYYEARLTNLADSGDIIVLVRNIVERKQLEQQLQQAQKMEALGQLTGGIAHDFNNILAAILGYSNLAMERCVTDPSDKLARYLGEVISATERARDLIAKMLAYSRTSSVVESVPLDMVPEVEKAVAMLSVAIPAGIEVATHIDPFVPSVRIDPIEVQQVLINLAVNSRDAIGEQGRIDITLELSRVNRKCCAICHNVIEGDFVALEVKDSGNGIPANIQQRIFDPFFTTKDVGKGSGLGLSMVQGVVIKNNAHLLIESSFEQGTSFRLLFPLADAESVIASSPIAKPVAPVAKHWRIWVVEDQESLAGYYLELLQAQGYQVTVFTDPANALYAFQLDPGNVDLVLTDQTMPHMSGAELATAMLAKRPELPIILATGYSETLNADEAKRIGIRCYLNKPVDGNKLLTILAAELRESSFA